MGLVSGIYIIRHVFRKVGASYIFIEFSVYESLPCDSLAKLLDKTIYFCLVYDNGVV